MPVVFPSLPLPGCFGVFSLNLLAVISHYPDRVSAEHLADTVWEGVHLNMDDMWKICI